MDRRILLDIILRFRYNDYRFALQWENIFKNSLKTGCHVLDDGCGAGFFTTLLASMGFQVTAVDYSTKMLEEVRRNLETEGLKAELHQMDVQSLEFADNSFDAVVSRNVFWNLEHADKLLSPFF